MAESIDDLFECFDEVGDEENVKNESESTEDDQISDRYVAGFINLKNIMLTRVPLCRVSEVHINKRKISDEDDKYVSKRIKEEDVDVGDIK